jgi:hypothetical protein
MDRVELEGLDRESLVLRAQAAGIKRARILTRPELIDELLAICSRASSSAVFIFRMRPIDFAPRSEPLRSRTRSDPSRKRCRR